MDDIAARIGDTPGTVYLVDHDHQVAGQHAKADAEIVLVPAPSDDPDDPLNWTPRRRMLANTCMLLYVFAICIESSVINSVITQFAAATDISIGDVITGNGYSYLLAGWGLLFWQPFAMQYGKRLTYLLSISGSAAFLVWAPYVKNNGQWIACNILSGFFNAPVEALPEITVADLYFTHERATYMGLYAFALVGGSCVGPVISGFINDRLNYRWVFYVPVIFCAFVFVFLFLFAEETNYVRGRTTNGGEAINAIQAEEKSMPALMQQPAIGEEENKQLPPARSASADVSSVEAGVVVPSKTSTKTFVQKLALLDRARENHVWTMFTNQIRFCSYPVVLFAGFEYGIALVWAVVTGSTASEILGAPPYNFSASMVGLSNVAGLLGALVGSLFGGQITDAFTLRMVRRNGGVFEPEMRLWLFTVPMIIIPASILLYGVGAAHGVHWIGILIGNAALSAANTAAVPLSINYLVDTYRDMAGMAMTVVVIIRNTMYFAVSYGIQDWIDGMGLQNAYISCAFIGMAATAVFLPMIYYGKTCRQRSAPAYRAMVDDAMRRGMVH
ncbi:hypothetical protein SBRCBS47491_004870 [Sporothrix bragantina]|uniref:Major facilitator superfamily (MFS) profile domain-containing protein n=1 Tax=Sporothrix bragantina TaxID=671064 RepID=A0ABP0BS75_9PEZI